MNLDIPDDLRTDILIVGAGPAGVAAAVNAGAEGMSALVVEDTAIGGQAGASSRIENYMGFPTGISGADLVFRGQIQALRFGACFAMPCRVERLSVEVGGLFCVTLDGGGEGSRTRHSGRDRSSVSPVAARTSGAVRECGSASMPPTETEARFCRNTDAVVVGGGNSAGQAAMYLSRVAHRVHILVRGDKLSDTMSSYLVQRLEAQPKIEIHFGTEVTALHGGDHLERITVRSVLPVLPVTAVSVLSTRALFLMIGASPNTGWLSDLVELDSSRVCENRHSRRSAAAARDLPTGYLCRRRRPCWLGEAGRVRGRGGIGRGFRNLRVSCQPMRSVGPTSSQVVLVDQLQRRC